MVIPCRQGTNCCKAVKSVIIVRLTQLSEHLIPIAMRCTAAPYCSHYNACGVVTAVITTLLRHLWNCSGRLRRAVPRATYVTHMHCNVYAMQCFAVFGCWVMPMLLECVIPWLSCACTLYREFFTNPSFSVSCATVLQIRLCRVRDRCSWSWGLTPMLS